MLKIVAEKPYVLRNLSPDQLNNISVIETALKQDKKYFKYAGGTSATTILGRAGGGKLLEYASDEVRNNEAAVRAALGTDSNSFRHASYALRNNIDVAKEAVRLNAANLQYVGEGAKCKTITQDELVTFNFAELPEFVGRG